ncbi:MAG: SbcC/MukB-like Walker B domain-containing protein, partial [Bacilli bacterium]|nr:SbcC/MukB-like Walker B domain-containing protein [Bacilli bacterium]
DDAVQKAQILQNIEKFTDYRTYLNFDLLVKRGNFAVESSLSRTFKKQSGGETQTPFYISILASFAQMYRVKNEKNNNTLRLVIFDEAFSKMDSTRIKEVVSLIKSFGLQAILSTPSEKIRDLANSVDLILVTMHDNKKARSYIDRYKEIK